MDCRGLQRLPHGAASLALTSLSLHTHVFHQGHAPTEGVAFLLDQLPGLVEWADVTPLLVSQGYVPSYNIPYFPHAFVVSGYQGGHGGGMRCFVM